MVCVFFGHRDAPTTISSAVYRMIEMLIVQKGIDVFYVGHQGGFDKMVYRELCRAKKKYPHIDCAVVLAYPPSREKNGSLKRYIPLDWRENLGLMLFFHETLGWWSRRISLYLM